MAKNPPANAGDTGSIPGSGRSPRERNSNPLQYSCLGNPINRGAWWGPKRVRHDLATKQQAHGPRCILPLEALEIVDFCLHC